MTQYNPPPGTPPPNYAYPPKPKKSMAKQLAAGLLAAFCAFYIINPTAGILEFIPDNFPLIGNLDEAGATTLLLSALSYLGLDLLPFSRRREDETR